MADAERKLTVLVLGGGPDRERPVSIKSAAAVSAALRAAGHTVIESDIAPGQDKVLDTPCDVVWPVLHGRFGEGGPLQRMMENKGVCFVGCRTRAASIAIDKCASKRAAEAKGVPTPPYQLLGPRTPLTMDPPVVIKALTEGSSFGVWICQDAAAVTDAREKLHAHFAFGLAETFIPGGRELTVGIVDGRTLPAIRIVPAADFYTYEAKYDRNDTRYEFDTGLSAATLARLDQYALDVFHAVGASHLARVDFMVDPDENPWFLEINTMPGFTDHSLVPMAAAKIGWDMPALCDRIVRLALHG